MAILVFGLAWAWGLPVMAGDIDVNQKMVWSHMIGWHSYHFVNDSYRRYHDVPMAIPSGNEVTDYRMEVDAILEAGIDGVTFDIIGGSKYRYQCRKLLEAAAGTRLEIANTLCGRFEKDPADQAAKIASAIKGFLPFANYAKVDGKPIFFTFWAYKKPPQYWLSVRKVLKEKYNQEIFLAGDPDAVWNKATSVEDLNKYAGVFDIYYNYAEYGLVDRQPPQELFAITGKAAETGTRTGKWAAAVAPGYRGAWPLNGRNEFYIPFRGIDRFWDAWEAAMDNDAPWIHLANWNDLDETPLQPMVFQFHTYSQINRYWSEKLHGKTPRSQTPKVYFAYQREQMLGTLEHIGILSLPMTNSQPVTVEGHLLDMHGSVVGQLAKRTFAGDEAGRDQWFVDTSVFASTPVLEPVITVTANGKHMQRRLPMIRLRTGWIENQVVIKAPLHEMSDGQAELQIAPTGQGMIRATVTVNSQSPVRRATLWCDDRPIGSLDISAQVKPTYGVRWKWLKDHSLTATVENGTFVRSFQHGPNASRFKTDTTRFAASINRYDYLAANISGDAQTSIVIHVNDGPAQRVTMGQLLKDDVQLVNADKRPVARLIWSDYDPLAALPRVVKCASGQLHGLFPENNPSASKLYYVRLQTMDGKIFFSNCITPYANNDQRIETRILKTTISLDHGGIATLPNVTEQVMAVKVHPAMVQRSQWNMAATGAKLPDILGNNPMYLGSGAVYYKSNPDRVPRRMSLPDGTTALVFDGIDDVAELPIRQQPHGAFSLSLRLLVDKITGQDQLIYGSTHEASAPMLMIDSQGHLVAGRQSDKPAFSVLARSDKPVPVQQWMDVMVRFDQQTTWLYRNGKLIGKARGKASRDYGNMRTYIGGIKQPFAGAIADMALFSVPLVFPQPIQGQGE
ncbi:MAG: LamG-like jellyroll fold domain-containing protein [Phycisphaeraceae bacterium JB051]